MLLLINDIHELLLRDIVLISEVLPWLWVESHRPVSLPCLRIKVLCGHVGGDYGDQQDAWTANRCSCMLMNEIWHSSTETNEAFHSTAHKFSGSASVAQHILLKMSPYVASECWVSLILYNILLGFFFCEAENRAEIQTGREEHPKPELLKSRSQQLLHTIFPRSLPFSDTPLNTEYIQDITRSWEDMKFIFE